MPANFIWKELYDLVSRPLFAIALLAVSFTVVWASGHLNVGKQALRIFLYKGDATATTMENALDVLAQFEGSRVFVKEGNIVDARAMLRSEARFAVVYRAGSWSVLFQTAASDLEEEAGWAASAIQASLENNKPDIALGTVVASRMSALPGEPHRLFVPRTIGLIVVFLPFILAARSQFRETIFGTLPVLLVAPGGGWANTVVAKVMVCTWAVFMVFIFLLLTIHPLFGFSPKSGFFSASCVQILAILVSSCLGLFVAVVALNQAQIFLSIFIYFIGLLLLSGFFFPLETAAPAVRWASHLTPLAFSGKLLEYWLFYGTDAFDFAGDIVWLFGQVAFGAALLVLGIHIVRRRI